jgi:glycosyltransferase involved in cell wall biosynthesis
LPQLPNIHWLGGKDYQDLPSYISGWDVAFMPFALNESTRFISPTKTPEFLAAGLPVVSTPVADVVRPYGESGLVEIAGSAEQVSAAIDKVMRRQSPAWRKKVDDHLSNMSWDSTWGRMLELISSPRSGNLDISRAALVQAALARPANV